MPFTIVRQDITKMQVDAIVNAANTQLRMGGGVCGAVFHAAGEEKLRQACQALAPIGTGEAVITPGFRLPARYVIHAAGPVYDGQNPEKSRQQLRSAYLRSMELARKNGCESIAFPLISSGKYGYPKDRALQTAVAAIREFLESWDMEVYLVIFDRVSFVVGEDLLGPIQSFLDEHYVDRVMETQSFRRNALQRSDSVGETMAMPMAAGNLQERLAQMDAPFSSILLRMIVQKGLKESAVYKRANMDRKLFSKIRNGQTHPKKRNVLALAIAMELSMEETDSLLEKAGYALSPCDKFDVIVSYFILRREYDIFLINEALFQYDQPVFGSC